MVDTKTDYDDRQAVFLDRQKYIESPDGPLNLLNQRDKIRERVADDFKRAAIRMTRAAQGLEQIFGYSDPLPALVANSDLLDTDALPLNRAVKWVRDAISWLIGFSQHDQAFTRCVSLRAANPSLWSQNAVDLHGDGATFRIEISRELFSSHKFVRLRGLSAFVVGDNVGYTPWRAIVTLPREAQYLRYDGPSFITQTLPSCDLGRVERWDIGREPEVCGSLSLLNGSPIGTPGDGGKWEITIKAPQQIDSSALKLEDFQLHIMVVGQPS